MTVACGRHGPMVRRDDGTQTPEQRWCGVWFDCTDPSCRASHLVPSVELAAVS